MHTTPKAVVFDLDGLMFNTESLYPLVAEALAEKYEKVFQPSVLDDMRGRQADLALRIFCDVHQIDQSPSILIEEGTEIFERILDEQLAPMPGLMRLLTALEDHQIPKAIGTSSRGRHVKKILTRYDLHPRFEFALCAEDVTQSKPHPEIYLTAAERLKLSAEEIMVLEDSVHGFEAAQSAGTQAVAIPGDYSRHYAFEGARLVADSLEDQRIYEILGIS